MLDRMTTPRIALVAPLALLLLACGAETDAPDDAGAPECSPTVTATGEYECPAGCVTLSASPLDDDRRCRLSTSTVLACHPPSATVSRSGDIACFEREGAPARVWSSSGSAVWTTPGAPTVELYSAEGWSRCDPDEGWETLAPSCDL